VIADPWNSTVPHGASRSITIGTWCLLRLSSVQRPGRQSLLTIAVALALAIAAWSLLLPRGGLRSVRQNSRPSPRGGTLLPVMASTGPTGSPGLGSLFRGAGALSARSTRAIVL
jgi:hypothetical protein